MTSNDHSLDNPDLTPWDENCASRYRDLGFWRGVPLDDIVSRGAVLFKDNIAIFSSKRSWTYGVLNQKVNELAAGFIKLGIRADEKVVVQLPNIGEFLEVVFALFRIGAVPVYTLPAHRYMEIESFCRLTDASAYIVADRVARFDYRELARKLLPSTSLKHVIIVGDAQEFTALDQLYQQPIACSPRKSSSIALLQLSGGTTNVPKLIPRTHDDYYYSVRESAKICCLNEASIYMAALPVAHNFPHSSPGVLGTLYAGGSVVMAESPAPDLAFDLIEKYAVTITALVPSLAMVWMAAGKNAHQELSSLQVIQVGGAKFGSESAKKLVSVFNCKLQQVFGMAEGLVNYTRLDDPDEITFYTQGRPISEADEIRIVDTEDNDLANGQVGELLTRGPYTIRG
ncbi:MAG: (2,3-dihydroxybenzoyl)adenylate synthase, partial [Gammaproteobacteria bacterium]